VFGAFNESESDSFYFNYLNFYVFSRVAWDTSVDVGEVVAEHHRLMYGKGANAMAKFFDRLEEIWLRDVVRDDAGTSTGGEPSYSPPGPYDLLMKVYSKAVLHELRGYLDEAAASEKGTLAGRRIRFAAEQLLGPIYKRARDYQRRLDPEDELARRKDVMALVDIPVDAKWWCRGMGMAVKGEKIVIDAKAGGKAQLGLKGAGVALKPNTRYRVSCFMDADLETLGFKQRKKGNGFLFELSEGASRKNLHRVSGIHGKRPRQTCGFEFTTGEKVEDGGYFAFRAYGVNGTVKIDGLALMELPPL
jgi:hypothetical protein